MPKVYPSRVGTGRDIHWCGLLIYYSYVGEVVAVAIVGDVVRKSLIGGVMSRGDRTVVKAVKGG